MHNNIEGYSNNNIEEILPSSPNSCLIGSTVFSKFDLS